MKNEKESYILTLSCKDAIGIVAAISGCLADMGAFIEESAQFSDLDSKMFFMRIRFSAFKELLTERMICELLEPIGKKWQMDFHLVNDKNRIKVAVFVTKEPHCLLHLIHRSQDGYLPIDIQAIVSNHEHLKPIADAHAIAFHRIQDEDAILNILENTPTDLVILAKYMQILSPKLCDQLFGKAINIHHSFLPSFKGAKPYHQAYERGVKIIGATAHFVTKNLDEGPIIAQETIHVHHAHSIEDLKLMGKDIESLVLARAVEKFAKQKVLLNNAKTVVFN